MSLTLNIIGFVDDTTCMTAGDPTKPLFHDSGIPYMQHHYQHEITLTAPTGDTIPISPKNVYTPRKNLPKEFHPPTAFSGRTGGNNEETKENNNCNGNCSDRASDFHATTSTTTTTTQREGTKRIIDV
eukprot:CAMPEP_0201278370 /NCGR_PEP_ID=MMETSP0853-20130426/60098_1 /ASSEMBLY_ACC=CAM_ASM_000640 /TAXON_ID=183588 /ORGANISM="Pseudo-nitzschia fraudulenta, Strain WWA7" /LENGTH=127 /DNA_ID=CAMNT_0047586681 /DNA_START=1227 /DNA_END=1610 /DNA_ORIENTATION=+